MIRDDPDERLSFIRPGALPGTELMIAYGSSQPWHVFHENYTFCACRAAAAGWRYRGRTEFLNDGSTMLLEPGEVHRNTTVHKPADFKVVMIAPELFKAAAEELNVPGTPHFRFAQIEDPSLFRAVYRFCASVESGDTVLRQQSLFATCLRLLLGYAERQPSRLVVANEHRAVRRAKVYLQERFSELVTLDELAAVAGLSRFRLVHAFAKHVGLPPHAYQIHVRIERARLLLRKGVLPAEVATDVGFADQSHFTRHFRRIMRITPSAYAQASG
jgi:AraC-like DNA-binding protein